MHYEELIGLVQSLSDSTRSVFNMFVIDGMSHREISENLGISEGTSKWHLFEARRILKMKVEKLYK
jgi:RNA polymerase sigma-70 factor (ECF subfamily)